MIKALRVPFTDSKKLTAGIVLGMLPLVNIVTILFVLGYAVKHSEGVLKKKYALPAWDNWPELFVNGLSMVFIIFLYLLPALFVGLLLNGNVIFRYMPRLLYVHHMFTAMPNGVIITYLVALLMLYFTPMAIMNFVKTGSIYSAFDFKKVFKLASRFRYLEAWLLMFIYSVAVIGIAFQVALYSAFTVVIPLALLGFVVMVLGLTQMHVWAELYKQKI